MNRACEVGPRELGLELRQKRLGERAIVAVTVANTNDAPTVANPIADRTATEDAAFAYQFPSNTFNDADGDALTYAATLADGSALEHFARMVAALGGPAGRSARVKKTLTLVITAP